MAKEKAAAAVALLAKAGAGSWGSRRQASLRGSACAGGDIADAAIKATIQML